MAENLPSGFRPAKPNEKPNALQILIQDQQGNLFLGPRASIGLPPEPRPAGAPMEVLPSAQQQYQRFIAQPMQSVLGVGLRSLLASDRPLTRRDVAHEDPNLRAAAEATARFVTPETPGEALGEIAGAASHALLPGSGLLVRPLARSAFQAGASGIGDMATGAPGGFLGGAVRGLVGGALGEAGTTLPGYVRRAWPGFLERTHASDAQKISAGIRRIVPAIGDAMKKGTAEELQEVAYGSVASDLLSAEYDKAMRTIGSALTTRAQIAPNVVNRQMKLVISELDDFHHKDMVTALSGKAITWEQAMDAYQRLGRAAFNEKTRWQPLGKYGNRQMDLQAEWLDATHKIEQQLQIAQQALGLDQNIVGVFQRAKDMYTKGQAIKTMLVRSGALDDLKAGTKEINTRALQYWLHKERRPLREALGPAYGDLEGPVTRGAGVGVADVESAGIPLGRGFQAGPLRLWISLGLPELAGTPTSSIVRPAATAAAAQGVTQRYLQGPSETEK